MELVEARAHLERRLAELMSTRSISSN